MSINPFVLNEFDNVSQDGEPSIITFYKLKYTYQHQKIDTIIYGISYSNFSDLEDKKIGDSSWSIGMFQNYYPILPIFKLKELRLWINYKVYLKTLLDNLILYPKLNHGKIFGTFKMFKSDKMVNDSLSSINRHYTYYGFKNKVSRISMNYIDSIINFTDQNKIK